MPLVMACEKEFLDKKPASNIIRPQTLEDLERMLDNDNVINRNGAFQRIASDEYYIISHEIWQNNLFTARWRNSYIWAKDVYEGETDIKDWDDLYTIVFYANSILEELDRIEGADHKRIEDIKGRALFVRAYALFDLVNTFAPFYDVHTAAVDLGVPIRLTADVNRVEKRATVQQCYSQIIFDLEEAASLIVSDVPPQLRTRQSKTAAYALLAKVYLNMMDYENALKYADLSLSLYSEVTNFNNIDLSTDQPFQWNNADVIYYTTQVLDYTTTSGVGSITAYYIGVDENLLELYDLTSDLRHQAYFGKSNDGNYYRKMMFGSTSVNLYPFTGLATDEIMLIKAECEARLNKILNARGSLIRLLKNRFTNGYSFDFDFLNHEELVEKILEERRKELVWRSIRWTDLKRLNKEGRKITIKRQLGDQIYLLEPNSPRYVFPIPDNELIHLK